MLYIFSPCVLKFKFVQQAFYNAIYFCIKEYYAITLGVIEDPMKLHNDHTRVVNYYENKKINTLPPKMCFELCNLVSLSLLYDC